MSANGTGDQDGRTWQTLSHGASLLSNLPNGWIESFKGNKNNITQDLRSIIEVMNDGLGILDGKLWDGKTTTLRFSGYNGATKSVEIDPAVESSDEIDLTQLISINVPVRSVEVSPSLSQGTTIATISVNGVQNTLRAPSVVVTPSLSQGTPIATISVNGASTTLYAPTQETPEPTPEPEPEPTPQPTLSIPIGGILPWMGNSSSVPDGYLLCDGSEVDIADYSDLYAVIGNKFGTASSASKFKLPKLNNQIYLQGSIISGNSVNAGLPLPTGGSTSITIPRGQSQCVGFTPGAKVTANNNNNDSEDGVTGLTVSTTTTFNSDTIYGQSSTVTPRSMTVLYLICAKT